MKKSRFILAMLLIFTMALSSVATFSVYADNTTDEVKALPSSTTLVGTKHLPPISNQGEIGSCASQSITYMQMTNAVSRYLHSIDPDIEWDPSSGDKKYLMSPKFTFDFSGSGTAWVYDILVDHGITTMDKHSFYMQPGSGAYKIFVAPGSKLQWKESITWAVKKGMLEKALEIRLQNWTSEEDQIWIRKDVFGDENGDIMLTTTEAGKALIKKVKEYVLDGNVVVTGGISGGWSYDKLTADGDIGKKGEHCLSWTTEGGGGHQVSIVGYDDNVECTINGATMKGAFLVANSWGDWMNDGYVWLMYDALNSKSEYPKIQEVRGNKRTISMDQFVFTDWRTDIAIGAPDLMVQVEVEVLNREGTAIYLTRRPVGSTDSGDYVIPKMFYYGPLNANTHPDYEMAGMKYTFSGKQIKDGVEAETGYFTLSYERLLETLEEGKTIADYEWGVKVYSIKGEPIVVKSVKLINAQKKVLAEGINDTTKTTVAEGGDSYQAKTSGSLKYWFKDLNLAYVNVNTAVEGVEVEFTNESSKYAAVGEEVSFKLNGSAGSSKVLVNGTEITAKDGVYTVKLAADTKIEVVADTSTPGTTPAPETTTPSDTTGDNGGNNTVVIIVVAVAVVALGVVAVIVVKKKKA